jgi:hypothetical protein
MPELTMTPTVAVIFIAVGMLGAAGVGWQIGRIMSPRPLELRDPARILKPGA